MPFKMPKLIRKKNTSVEPPSNIVDELRESFNKFDTDKSGFLTLDEIQAALRELGRRENASVIQTILQLKGLEDGITFTDFVRFFTSATFA